MILRMCKSIFGYGNTLLFDNGFCVVKGLFHLEERGVYSSALIKKRRYWPNNVSVEEVDKKIGMNKLEIRTFWKPIWTNENLLEYDA